MKIAITSDTHRGFSPNTHLIHEKFGAKLGAEDWDVLVLAGDIASHKQEQFREALRFWREVADKRPVLLVRGNHDLWGRAEQSLKGIYRDQADWCAEFCIHLLQHGAWSKDDVSVVGWDGWYGGFPYHSNDFRWMPETGVDDQGRHEYLSAQCSESFHYALSDAKAAFSQDRTVIAVTHFPIVPGVGNRGGLEHDGDHGLFPQIAPYVDVLVQGHSHRAVYKVVDEVLIVNAGSDYDRPRYVILDIEKDGTGQI